MSHMAQIQYDPNWVPEDSFASRLRQLRHAMRNISVDGISEMCGIASATWSTWERGTTPQQQAAVVAKIAAATRCDRDWLMWGGQNLKMMRAVETSTDEQLELGLGINRPFLEAVR